MKKEAPCGALVVPGFAHLSSVQSLAVGEGGVIRIGAVAPLRVSCGASKPKRSVAEGLGERRRILLLSVIAVIARAATTQMKTVPNMIPETARVNSTWVRCVISAISSVC
jgi:hypothetical protein